ncbi:hypothetical protein J6590_078990 [Homalodisca vitripennis]|nr:hypothetical protein J6590_078990 [Homalodisca vitripennis]
MENDGGGCDMEEAPGLQIPRMLLWPVVYWFLEWQQCNGLQYPGHPSLTEQRIFSAEVLGGGREVSGCGGGSRYSSGNGAAVECVGVDNTTIGPVSAVLLIVVVYARGVPEVELINPEWKTDQYADDTTLCIISQSKHDLEVHSLS